MLTPPIEPMLAKPIGHQVPDHIERSLFEPKWDGFRCLAFRSSGGVVLQGRGRSRASADEVVDLAYAFPEVVAAIAQLPVDTVVDGEIVVSRSGRLDFGALSSRLRPRSEAGGDSIRRLAADLPASFLAFDALWSSGGLLAEPFSRRREVLESLAADFDPPVLLTPTTSDPTIARSWFTGFEAAGVDGLIVKGLDDPYTPGKRVQGKIKHQRSADVVVAGWRQNARPGPDGAAVVGSLLLGLHDAAGRLHYVGATSAFDAATRRDLVEVLAPLSVPDGARHPWRGEPGVRVPGTASRWNKGQAWHAVSPDLVAEVTYDQLEEERFRHLAGFLRWRPDRDPGSCGYDQLERPSPADITGLFERP